MADVSPEASRIYFLAMDHLYRAKEVLGEGYGVQDCRLAAFHYDTAAVLLRTSADLQEAMDRG